MGSSFFHDNPLFGAASYLIGPQHPDVQMAPGAENYGPYSGVNATLAGANAMYRAGGPGAQPGIPNAASASYGVANPYAAAARGATVTSSSF
jgi:hypothetical protein